MEPERGHLIECTITVNGSDKVEKKTIKGPLTAKQLKDNLQWKYSEKISMLTITQTRVSIPRHYENTEDVPPGHFDCFLVLEGSIAIFYCEKFH